jgi:hypothetical protein
MKMRNTLFLVICLWSTAAFGQQTIGNVKWNYAYEDLGKACNSYYSLYPPWVKCIEDRLYKVRYKILYWFQGDLREVYLSYIPDPTTRLDANGNIVPRNHSISEENKS